MSALMAGLYLYYWTGIFVMAFCRTRGVDKLDSLGYAIAISLLGVTSFGMIVAPFHWHTEIQLQDIAVGFSLFVFLAVTGKSWGAKSAVCEFRPKQRIEPTGFQMRRQATRIAGQKNPRI